MLKALSKYPIGFLVCSAIPVTACLLWLKNGANFIHGVYAEAVDHRGFAKPIELAITDENLLQRPITSPPASRLFVTWAAGNA